LQPATRAFALEYQGVQSFQNSGEKKVKKFLPARSAAISLKTSCSKALFHSNLSIHKSSTRYPQTFKLPEFPRFDFYPGSISFVHLTKNPLSGGLLQANKNLLDRFTRVRKTGSP
jgi:hypothetical protein